MTVALHTPYDGSAKLFQIGVKPLSLADWIEVDGRLVADLAEKERVSAAHAGSVFVAEPGTEPAQAELLALLVEHLTTRFPQHYRRSGDGVEIVPAGKRVTLGVRGEAPLRTAAKLVQEDLVLMRRGEAGWRLAAASLCFPSSWSLVEKFGRPLHEIHGPVPGFGAGTRNAQLIERMFDNARPEMPMMRWNWSLYGDDRLFHPETADPDARRFGAGERAASVFLRVERQTVRKLPMSGDILFAIRIHVDPLARLEQHPEAARIAGSLVAQLTALGAVELDYKGLTLERDRLVARLAEISASAH
ncbi:heme-dependent oxidative N-demethylase family protein [Devosia sp.]|uniref:heme-dependent oxidative N-demethylase family protein n=1 Tax=Devosia sp. TaxID=1871048 RepID=UPI003F712D8E